MQHPDHISKLAPARTGNTSQPCMGAIVNALYGTPLDTGIDPNELSKLSIFWEQVRGAADSCW